MVGAQLATPVVGGKQAHQLVSRFFLSSSSAWASGRPAPEHRRNNVYEFLAR